MNLVTVKSTVIPLPCRKRQKEMIFYKTIAAINSLVSFSLALDLHQHHQHGEAKRPIFFVPTFKPAAPLAARLFALEKGHFR